MKQTYARIISLAMFGGFSTVTSGATLDLAKCRDHGALSSVRLSLGDQRLYRALTLCRQGQVGPEDYFEEGSTSKSEGAAEYI